VSSQLAERLFKTLPKTIRFGSQVYKFVLTDYPADKRLWGEFDADLHEVRLCREMPTQGRFVATVIHEILHGLWHSRGLQDEVKEEAAVENLEPAIYAFIAHNRRLVLWLLRECCRSPK
jgi:hypothetical protein